MVQVRANGIALEYESFGAETAEPIILIMGLGAQLTRWPVELCEELVARGYRVIRFDNRDVGLSSKLDAAGAPDMRAVLQAITAGARPEVPYTLDDMASDVVGLMDALGLPRAHIVGASLGGMIAQLLAADHPERVLSLTSLMSSSGNPNLPPAKPEAQALLMSRPQGSGLDAIIAYGVNAARIIGSPAYPTDGALLQERVRTETLRSYHPPGFARQLAAAYASGDRRAKLKTIRVPTMVIHGADDPLVPVEAGRDTAANIPGARLRILSGMGHDIPVQLVGELADAIDEVASLSRAG